MILVIVFILSSFFGIETKPNRERMLPKIIWTYKSFDTNNILHNLCIQKMQRSVEKSRWVLNVINQQNINKYITNIQNYSQLFINTKQQKFNNKIQLLKVILLKQNGGLWIDPAVIMVQQIDEILDMINQAYKYGQQTYQLILFQEENQAKIKKNSKNYKLTNNQNKTEYYKKIKQTSMILALKNSPILNKWVQSMMLIIKQQQIHQQKSLIQNIHLNTLNEIIFNVEMNNQSKQNNFKKYHIWRYFYHGFTTQFVTFLQSEDKYLMADMYIKYQVDRIIQNFGEIPSFISLYQISKELSNILQPQVSPLVYFHDILAFQSQCKQQNYNCIHYILKNSLIHKYLIQQSEGSQIKITLQDQIKNCNIKYYKYQIKQLYFAVQLIAILIMFYLIIRGEYILIKILINKYKFNRQPLSILMRKRWKKYKKICFSFKETLNQLF